MLKIEESGPAYMLPYLLNRDAGGRSFDDVLIIGAGSGNDVAAALRQGAKHVDAVEIDPVIYDLGRRDHPNRPYRDPRVSVHLDDGRSFVRKTERRYDLIVYALVDSLALHSSYSSVRLESFLFTEEAFRDVKAKLKPGGVFAMYNLLPPGMGRRPAREAGRDGLRRHADRGLAAVPGDDHGRGQSAGIHHLPARRRRRATKVVEAIRSRLERDQSFWLNTQPIYNEPINGYRAEPPPRRSGRRRGDWLLPSVPAGIQEDRPGPGRCIADRPRPDRRLAVPLPARAHDPGTQPAAAWRSSACSRWRSCFLFAPVRRVRPNGQMFFLGAGFMLLETKGVVHMALLFGATWMVNSIVFFAILTMILLAQPLRPGQ